MSLPTPIPSPLLSSLYPLPNNKSNWGGNPDYRRKVHVVVNNFEHTPNWIDLSAAGITVPRRLDDVVTDVVTTPSDFIPHLWTFSRILVLAGILYLFISRIGVKRFATLQVTATHRRTKATEGMPT